MRKILIYDNYGGFSLTPQVFEMWLQRRGHEYELYHNKRINVGKYEKIRHSFLNKIIRFDNLFTAIHYFSWAKIGYPYTGVGRNMAYKKEEFFNVNGFIEHIQIRIGEDELFINQTANGKNTAITFTPESFTCCKPKTSFKSFFNQKKRHIATTRYFKWADRLQLKIFNCSQLLFILTAALLFSFQFEQIVVLSIFIVRYVIVWIVVGFSAGKLKENDLKLWFPIVEIVLIFIQVNTYFTNLFSKPVHWK
jgi:hypothetical protein